MFSLEGQGVAGLIDWFVLVCFFFFFACYCV